MDFEITPQHAAVFDIRLRIPGWANNEAMPSDLYKYEDLIKPAVFLSVNGKQVDYKVENGYAVLHRKWTKGDHVRFYLNMSARTVVANATLKDDLGKVALQRGPIIYCAEWKDNSGSVSNIVMPKNIAVQRGLQSPVT